MWVPSQPQYYSLRNREKFPNPLDSQSHDLPCEQHSPFWGESSEIMDVELIFKITGIIHK